MQIPFIGGAYEASSLGLNAQRSINCFPVIDNKEAKNVLSLLGTPGLKPFVQATVYGSGADGVVTIASDTTLTRDMQYTTLTVNSGKTLNTAGFTVCVSGVLTNNGIITDSTSGGSGGTGGVGYGNAGVAGASGAFSGSGAGGDGGAGKGTTGTGGTGGKGGGQVRIYAKTLTNNGTIHVNAGNATDPSGDSGDGADGGNGGTATLTYDARTVGTVTATAGTHTLGVAYGIDAYTKLCVSIASAAIADINSPAKTITLGGDAKVDTGIFKFDTGSVRLDGTGDYLQLAASTDFYMGTGDATISCFVRFNSFKAFGIDAFWCHKTDASNYIEMFLSNKVLYVNLTVSGVTTSIIFSETLSDILLNTWYHFELDRYGNTWYAFVDGYARSTGSCSDSWPNFTGYFEIGRSADGASFLDGWVCDFKVEKGIARHTANFTPPTAPCTIAVDGTAGTAGTTTWVNVPYFAFSSAAFRGGIVANGKMYVVIGANVLSITSAGVVSGLGVITTSTGNVFLAYNGTQVLIVDGTAYGHYIPVATDVLTDIADADFPAATSCTFMDGYFVVTKASTGRFYISGLYDATSWDALDYATAEGNPDNLVRCFHTNNNLWLFGSDSTEVWYNAGVADFPFVRIQGALIEDGLVGTAAVCLIKDQFYFLSSKLEVLQTSGYSRNKISTIHIDREIQGYTTVSDAMAYEYRIAGHLFFVLTFPTEDKTWVYDITTDYWHEWQSYKTQGTATYGRHRGNVGFFFNYKYVIGDYSNGSLYYLDMDTYTDNGEIIKRTRRAQVINKDRKRLIFHNIELDFEVGVGIGGTGTGSDPTVSLCWSDDNANTWSNSYTKNLGKSGDYTREVIWRRLGQSKNRIYELTMSQPVKFSLFAAYADIEECAS
jgi:hypothetical protein